MNFFGMGPGELLLILVVALIVFGPGKLPEIGSAIGKSIREFKRATSEMTQELTQSVNDVKQPIEEVKNLASLTEPQTFSGTHTIMDSGKVCSKCSARNPSSNKFCGNCGADLSVAEAQSADGKVEGQPAEGKVEIEHS